MSQPKRYDDQGVWKCLYYEDSTNGWVKWDDYAALAAENERLRSASFVTAVPAEQYERVIKIGNTMYQYIYRICAENDEMLPAVCDKWLDAKDGK